MVTGSSATEYTAKVSKKFCGNASPEIEMFVSKDFALAGGFKDLCKVSQSIIPISGGKTMFDSPFIILC